MKQALLLLSILGIPIATAAEDDADVDARWQIDEIVVTAEKRETFVQDTSVAISAFEETELDFSGIQNIEDLTFHVPNLHFGRAAAGPGFEGGITIRGVSSAGGDPSTALHVDGIYQNAAATTEALTFYDVQRVEVLRGPQGTLYGRNATGGTVNVVSNPPSSELEVGGDFQLGNYDQIRARGFLNLPLGDYIASRVSFYVEDRDGYQKRLNSSVRNHDLDDADQVAIRAQMKFDISDDARMTVRGNWSDAGGKGFALKTIGDFPDEIFLNPDLPPLDLYENNGASPNPNDPRHIRTDFVGERDDTAWSVNGDLEWDFNELPILGDVRMTTIASFVRRDDYRLFDGDLADIPLFNLGIDDEVKEAVGEIRLASNGGGDLEWVTGLFLLHSQEDLVVSAQSFPFSMSPPAEGAIEVAADQATDRDARSLAVFGQGIYSFLEDFRATLGLRYSYDYKRASFFVPAVFLNEGDDTPFVFETDTKDSKTWDAVTGKVGLDWFWRDGSLAYASISRGYKAGLINTAPILDSETGRPTGGTIDNADPEFIWAYELGSKNLLFDNRLQTNLTAFYYDYDDLQVNIIAENQSVVQNAAEATIWGFEAELLTRPIEGLTVLANASYLDTEFDEFTGFREEDRFQTPVDFSGNQLPRAPRYSGQVAAQYDWDFGRWGTISPRAQFFWSDEVFFRAANDDTDRQEAYTKTDLRIGWFSEGGNLGIEAFADNLTDEDVIQSQIVASSLIGWPIQSVFNAPRTYGVRLSAGW